MSSMTSVEEKYGKLPEPLQNKIAGYIDAMTEVAEEAKRLFLEEFAQAEKSGSISDEEFKARLEAKYGPLDI